MIEANLSPKTSTIVLRDTFDDDHAPGTVIGSLTADRQRRQGVDVEGIIGIDHDALRLEPLIESGWGRAGLSYGPYTRENGLTFAVFMLNGHNTSQLDVFADTLAMRFRRWALGSASRSDGKRVLIKRFSRWVASDHPRTLVRRWRWWRRLRLDSLQNVTLDENLAVGWFPQAVPPAGTSLPEGSTFVMHALGGENGELWVTGGASPLRAIRGVQNVPLYFVVVLRERGAAYYVASSPNAYGMAAFPQLRPLAIEPFRDDPDVYAGVHQSVMGQIGFRIDTRVYGTAIAKLESFAEWYGTAHAADTLVGDSLLGGSDAPTGGLWQHSAGSLRCTPQGAVGTAPNSLALLDPTTPSGLVHAIIDVTGANGAAGLVWRAVDASNHWSLQLDGSTVTLSATSDGKIEPIATGAVDLTAGAHSLQVLDDGTLITAYLDGALLFDQRFSDTRLQTATGVGIVSRDNSRPIHHFEAHPRVIDAPPALDLGTPWYRLGERVVVSERFDGDARTLEGKPTTIGNKIWQRSLGHGSIDLHGDGMAKVHASAAEPNPGRTAFTFDWDHPQFADLELTMTPPGAGRGEDEKGRCGVVFWQDEDNFVIVSLFLDDAHPGVSISSFFHLNGFEEIYDAVWTNTTRHITWGEPFRLRVVCDGLHYLAMIDDEPVLYRALTDVYPKFNRLTLARVGMLVNWEWGNDTGSSLHSFSAKV